MFYYFPSNLSTEERHPTIFVAPMTFESLYLSEMFHGLSRMFLTRVKHMKRISLLLFMEFN